MECVLLASRAVEIRKLSALVAVLFSLLALGLFSAPAYADDTTINIPHSCQPGGNVLVPAASPLTIVSGWTMSTRGNTEAFANAATGIMTVNGQLVSATKSDVFHPGVADIHPDGNADDAWRVQWSFTTTSPGLGQSVVVTWNILLARDVADHELGSGRPTILSAGLLFQPPLPARSPAPDAIHGAGSISSTRPSPLGLGLWTRR
jgi:hypothetical protein